MFLREIPLGFPSWYKGVRCYPERTYQGNTCPENNFYVVPRWFPPFASQFFSHSKKLHLYSRFPPAA